MSWHNTCSCVSSNLYIVCVESADTYMFDKLDMNYGTHLSLISKIDECEAKPGPCDINANCVDADGSYECTCNRGYSGNGSSCSGNTVCKTSVRTGIMHTYIFCQKKVS